MKSSVHADPMNTSSHLLQALTFLMLMCTTYGLCLRAGDSYEHWHTQRQIVALLHIIHNRQIEYRQVSHTFAGNLEALHVKLPDDLKATIFAGPVGNQPSYAAEVCARLQCWLIDQRGEPLQRRVARPLRRFYKGAPVEAASVPAVASLEPGAQAPASPEGQSPDASAPEKPKTLQVVPRGPATAFGLKAGTPLPALSPTRDTAALWGPLEEVHR